MAEPGQPAPAGRHVPGRFPPPPEYLVAFAEQRVDHAQLKFKSFRQDFERVNNAATAAWRDGLISKDDATLIFFDAANIVSGPLVRRYVEARACEQVAKWLKSRPEFHFSNWLSPRNRMALDGFAAHGQGALAVTLICQHLNKVMARALQYGRGAARKQPAGLTDAQAAKFQDNQASALELLPGELALATLEIAELEPWIIACGSDEDRMEIIAMKEELAKMRGRFNLA